MKFELVIADIDPKKVAYTEDEILDLAAQNYIYEHLRYFCSKCRSVPSITVRIESDSIFATSRSLYLRIAKDLNLPIIQAVVDKTSDEPSVKKLAKNKEIVLVDYNQLRNAEKPVNLTWHVYFFERPLDEKEKSSFKELIFEQFKSQTYLSDEERENPITTFNFSHSDACAEFKGFTPVENHLWARELLQKIIGFHLKTVKIISFQGRKFLF